MDTTDATAGPPSSRARARHVRMSPTKVRRVVDIVRGMPTSQALGLLEHAPQSASRPVAKLIASAVANAEHNDGLNPNRLVVTEAYVDEGPTLKRIRPRAQGRAYRIRKRTSHITVVVSESPASETAAAAGKSKRRAR